MTEDQAIGIAVRAFMLGVIGVVWGWARTKKEFWKRIFPAKVVDTNYVFGFVVWLCLLAAIGIVALIDAMNWRI